MSGGFRKAVLPENDPQKQLRGESAKSLGVRCCFLALLSLHNLDLESLMKKSESATVEVGSSSEIVNDVGKCSSSGSGLCSSLEHCCSWGDPRGDRLAGTEIWKST